MNRQMKYLRRLDTGLVIEVDPVFLEVVKMCLDQAGIRYEVLDTPPQHEVLDTPPEKGEVKPKRRRSS
jgi:hypothetical protein